jgi:chromosome segregation ATPase
LDNEEEANRSAALNTELKNLLESHGNIDSMRKRLAGDVSSPTGQDGGEKAHIIEELQEQIASLKRSNDNKDAELADLRARLLQEKPAADQLQRETFDLRDALRRAEEDATAAKEEAQKLRAELSSSVEKSERLIEELQDRADELLDQLEERDKELNDARKEAAEQEEQFANKMHELEGELGRVLEEQGAALDDARARVEEAQSEVEKLERVASESDRRAVASEAEARALRSEKEKLEDALDSQTTTDPSGSSIVSDGRTALLRERIEHLEAAVTAKEDQLREAGARAVSSAEQQATLRRRLSEVERSEAAAQKRVEGQETNLKQMEEALDESERQMLANEAELDRLRGELREAKARLERIDSEDEDQYTDTFTHRSEPLQDKVSVERVRHLEAQLDSAEREVGRLRALAEAPSLRTELEVKEVELETLQARNRELESRIINLREQNASFSSFATPAKANKSVEKSVRFEPIIGIRTPKTPGAFFRNVSVIFKIWGELYSCLTSMR